jgi:hypothetical protein
MRYETQKMSNQQRKKNIFLEDRRNKLVQKICEVSCHLILNHLKNLGPGWKQNFSIRNLTQFR